METVNQIKKEALAKMEFTRSFVHAHGVDLRDGDIFVSNLINRVVAAVKAKYESKTPPKLQKRRSPPGTRGSRSNKAARRSA